MKKTPACCSVAMYFVVASFIIGCGSADHGGSNLPVQQQDTSTQSQGATGMLVDNPTDVTLLRDDPDHFDPADYLFTESDRLWFCAVEASEFALSDEVYFRRGGTAEFSRFGAVSWDRNLPDAEITITSPFIDTAVMKDIGSANTTLQFVLVMEGLSDQFYDCVLVSRDGDQLAFF